MVGHLSHDALIMTPGIQRFGYECLFNAALPVLLLITHGLEGRMMGTR